MPATIERLDRSMRATLGPDGEAWRAASATDAVPAGSAQIVVGGVTIAFPAGRSDRPRRRDARACRRRSRRRKRTATASPPASATPPSPSAPSPKRSRRPAPTMMPGRPRRSGWRRHWRGWASRSPAKAGVQSRERHSLRARLRLRRSTTPAAPPPRSRLAPPRPSPASSPQSLRRSRSSGAAAPRAAASARATRSSSARGGAA